MLCTNNNRCIYSFRPLGPENLLLKGATLKNTKKIYGKCDILIHVLCLCKKKIHNPLELENEVLFTL